MAREKRDYFEVREPGGGCVIKRPKQLLTPCWGVFYSLHYFSLLLSWF